jgi:hypothetical protein
MSKSNTFENDILKAIFWGTAIANLLDNAASSPLTSLYIAFHTADPGEAGSQTTSECAYPNYARVAVLRSASGFAISNNIVTLVARAIAPQASGGTETATHWSVGVASSGTSKILYSGTITPNISISNGVSPFLETTTSITED